MINSKFLIVAALVVAPVQTFAIEALSTPTGVHQWQVDKAYNGYTLLSPNTMTDVFLIDMEGDIVHTWKTAGKPGLYAELLPNGNLLRGLRPDKKIVPFGGNGGIIQELDWDGNVVWEYKIHEDHKVAHHAYERLPNGNTLILAWEYKTYDEAVAKGRIEGTLPKVGEAIADDVPYDGIWSDYIVEVDPKGNEVWSWHVWDHIGTGEKEFDINYKLAIDNYYGDSDWMHLNSIRYIPETDQILTISRNFSELLVIDKATGAIVKRWGNPTTHQNVTPPGFAHDGGQILFGPHDPTWLKDGQVLLFDNGWLRPQGNRSRALIVDLKMDKIGWQYQAENPNSFYSAYQGSAQKLANGNVLITSTQTGHLIEVTGGDKPEVVWEYISPWTHKGAVALLGEEHTLGPDDINILGNTVHRTFRYSQNYQGFSGRDLSKKQILFPDAPKWYKEWQSLKGMKSAF